MCRNELANYLLKASKTQQLPPMLRVFAPATILISEEIFTSKCNFLSSPFYAEAKYVCRSCRHLSVCSIYHKAYGGTEGSGLVMIARDYVILSAELAHLFVANGVTAGIGNSHYAVIALKKCPKYHLKRMIGAALRVRTNIKTGNGTSGHVI
ncbi:hypothetical protein OROMI_011780 [Orobanche minor]